MEALAAEGVAVLSSLDVGHAEYEIFLAAGFAGELVPRCEFLLDDHVVGGGVDDYTLAFEDYLFAEDVATLGHLDRADLDANEREEAVSLALVLAVYDYPGL